MIKVSEFINSLKSQINESGYKTNELKIDSIEWNSEISAFCVDTVDRNDMTETYYISTTNNNE